jgi:predicted metalloprotease with PDZ domain
VSKKINAQSFASLTTVVKKGNFSCRWIPSRKFLLVVFTLLLPSTVLAQPAHAQISIDSIASARLNIKFKSPVAKDRWSFRNAYGGLIGLGDRIESFSGVGVGGQHIGADKLTAGEYRTNERVSVVQYTLRIETPSRAADKSHVSWLDRSGGLLMLADLLPLLDGESSPVNVNLRLPKGWTSSSNLNTSKESLQASDSDDAVIVVGPEIREVRKLLENGEIVLTRVGDWPFSENETMSFAQEVIQQYTRITGFPLQRRVALTLLPLQAGPGRWTAETRGNSVLVLLSNQESKRQLLGRLNIILTHEIFHLWVPNSLKLDGDYDWFFEGFTLYQALVMSMQLGLIDFQEYLSTLARVYDSYLDVVDRDELSLLELSPRRWTSGSSLVYDKGMLVAFIYDLTLRRRTAGKSSLADAYRSLFQRSKPKSGEANSVITSVLNTQVGMNDFSSHYIEKSEPIDLSSFLRPFGIEVLREDFRTRLSVSPKIDTDQRRILRDLGYED